ncbi:hypothetical protein BDV96DRAFT_525199 [Lophiotrema nucula]|uniref:PinX1-related protein 1 n=1 Tax=Lophiotrema nucula TaxID=690887 RepID=A0A6A5YZ74_9PLEO|nr:hypothetical protein BDV96DRAFT_525199 [Lophiotrema nucula]
MGLAAPKNRSKISNDPQNTTWSTNTTRFGHRLLTSQGWSPGTSLGAKNANHAAHYTAASHSHVRVFLKEDNLGLGAKLGSERPENFGLAGLESVLGRLNGREAEVKVKEEERKEVQRRGWVSARYGGMNFVSGGFLVGGDIVSKKELKDEDIKIEVKKEEGSDGERKVLEIEEKKTKKRKRVKLEDPEIKTEDVSEEEPKLKRKKKSMDLRAAAVLQDAIAIEASSSTTPKSKKDKKSKKTSSTDPSPTSPAPASDTPLSDKAKRKAEKRARKEEKKLKKALKKAAKEAAKSKSTPDTPADSSSSDEDENEETESPAGSSIPTTGTSTPITAAGLTFGAGGRHAVRQRYIRQKKMASMDPQALKEIFMIKT